MRPKHDEDDESDISEIKVSKLTLFHSQMPPRPKPRRFIDMFRTSSVIGDRDLGEMTDSPQKTLDDTREMIRRRDPLNQSRRITSFRELSVSSARKRPSIPRPKKLKRRYKKADKENMNM